MAPHKIEHFERDNPGRRFPMFEPVDRKLAGLLWQAIASKVGEAGSPDPVISRAIESTSIHLTGMNAEEDEFDLRMAMNEARIQPSELVYLDWMEHSVDQMAFSDMRDYFDDIWYPSSDDLLLYDDSLDWLVLITHYGAVLYRKFD